MSEEETVESDRSFLVGKKEDLIEAKHTSITVGNRVLLVIHHQGVFYAMDKHCYQLLLQKINQHILTNQNQEFKSTVVKLFGWSAKYFATLIDGGAQNQISGRKLSQDSDEGGSLLNADIEEIDNKLCIVCPKHKYKISLAEGEGLYSASKHKDQPPCWLSKGIKQRVHKVTEVDGNIYVMLSKTPGWIESDYYQTEKGRAELKKAKNKSQSS